jgi:hypothetical protein
MVGRSDVLKSGFSLNDECSLCPTLDGGRAGDSGALTAKALYWSGAHSIAPTSTEVKNRIAQLHRSRNVILPQPGPPVCRESLTLPIGRAWGVVGFRFAVWADKPSRTRVWLCGFLPVTAVGVPPTSRRLLFRTHRAEVRPPTV